MRSAVGACCPFTFLVRLRFLELLALVALAADGLEVLAFTEVLEEVPVEGVALCVERLCVEVPVGDLEKLCVAA